MAANSPQLDQGLDDTLYAQQHIFDRQHNIIGSELLYRACAENKANFDDAQKATATVVVNVCANISNAQDEALNNRPVFINVASDNLMPDAFLPVDKNRVVLELDKDSRFNDDAIDNLRSLRRKGYAFALDRYSLQEANSSLLKVVNYVKVDVLSTKVDEHQNTIAALKARNKKLIAERVEDLKQFEHCSQLGFDYFQGYYLERPVIAKGKKIAPMANTALQIINALQSDDVDFEKVSYMVARDPKLSFQLLKILNSPAQGLSSPITSLRQAVTYLGVSALQKWVILISLVNASTAPMPLFNVLLRRARTCEMFARHKQLANPDQFFTVGLLSGIDAILSLEMGMLLRQIKIAHDIHQALVNHRGQAGGILKHVLYLEKGEFNKLISQCQWQDNLLLSQLFEDGGRWADSVMTTI